MLQIRTINNKINYLHKRCLGMVYSDKKSSFGKLSETDRSIPIHVRNLQILATELFKVTKYLAPTNFRDTFSKQSVQYNLRHPSEFPVPNVKAFFLYRKFDLSRTKYL